MRTKSKELQDGTSIVNELKIVLKQFYDSHIIFSAIHQIIYKRPDIASDVLFDRRNYQYYQGLVIQHSQYSNTLLDEIKKQIEKFKKRSLNYKIMTRNALESSGDLPETQEEVRIMDDEQVVEEYFKYSEYVNDVKEEMIEVIIKRYIDIYGDLIGNFIEMKLINLNFLKDIIGLHEKLDNGLEEDTLDRIHTICAGSNPKTVIRQMKELFFEDLDELEPIIEKYRETVVGAYQIGSSCAKLLFDSRLQDIVGRDYYRKVVMKKFINFHNSSRFFIIPTDVIVKRNKKSLNVELFDEFRENQTIYESLTNKGEDDVFDVEYGDGGIIGFKNLYDYEQETDVLDLKDYTGVFRYNTLFNYLVVLSEDDDPFIKYTLRQDIEYPIDVKVENNLEPLDFNDPRNLFKQDYPVVHFPEGKSIQDIIGVRDLNKERKEINKSKSKNKKGKRNVSISENSRVHSIPHREDAYDVYLLDAGEEGVNNEPNY